jgi:hypothetical protein
VCQDRDGIGGSGIAHRPQQPSGGCAHFDELAPAVGTGHQLIKTRSASRVAPAVIETGIPVAARTEAGPPGARR